MSKKPTRFSLIEIHNAPLPRQEKHTHFTSFRGGVDQTRLPHSGVRAYRLWVGVSQTHINRNLYIHQAICMCVEWQNTLSYRVGRKNPLNTQHAIPYIYTTYIVLHNIFIYIWRSCAMCIFDNVLLCAFGLPQRVIVFYCPYMCCQFSGLRDGLNKYYKYKCL